MVPFGVKVGGIATGDAVTLLISVGRIGGGGSFVGTFTGIGCTMAQPDTTRSTIIQRKIRTISITFKLN